MMDAKLDERVLDLSKSHTISPRPTPQISTTNPNVDLELMPAPT